MARSWDPIPWRKSAPLSPPVPFSIPDFSSESPPALPRQIVFSPQAPPTSGLAVASLVLGIVGFLTAGMTAIPAVVCGHLSLSDIKKAAGRISGSGLATAGLITGYIGIGYLAIMLVMMVFMFSVMGIFAKGMLGALTPERTQCVNHAKQIATACERYARDHAGYYPAYLTDLVPKYVPDRSVLTCPLLKYDESVGYDYFRCKASDPGEKVLLISHGEWNNKKVVITRDGSEKESPEQPATPEPSENDTPPKAALLVL
jgi:hypothetical protein